MIKYSKADIAGMKLELQATNWHDVFGVLSIENSWLAFKHRIHEIEARYIPAKSVQFRQVQTVVDVSQGTEGCEAQT